MAVLSTLLFLLSWVGWRYFLGPVQSAFPARVEPNRAKKAICDPALTGVGPRGALLPWSISFALVLLVGGTVIGVVFMLSEWIAPEPLEAVEMDRQAHIQAALNPERLVPPPALPPSLFIASERPALETADRDWGKLNPRFIQTLLQALVRLQERGYTFALLEGYRSPERQEKLAGMGNHITNARAFQSKHQYGQAVDLAPLRDGKLLISERDPWAMAAYTALGEEVEKSGLTWGGRWWFKDFGHVEVAGSVTGMARTGQDSSLRNK